MESKLIECPAAPLAEVRVEEALARPLPAIWGMVGDFAGIARWHPLVVACEMSGTEEALTRTVHFADGSQVRERLMARDEGSHRLDYQVLDDGSPSRATATVTIQLVSLAPGHTMFSWSAITSPDVATRLPAFYRQRLVHLRKCLGLPQ